MVFRDFFSALPLLHQVDPYRFYVPGYSEALSLFSDVRVVLDESWLSGVPSDLQDYFFITNFPCFFIPIFTGKNCYGFVLKGFRKETPRFCTNMLLPGCERIKGGELVVLCEGMKDCFVPLYVSKGLPVVVVPLLTSVPSRDFLGFLKSMNCSVLFIPDNDERRGNHTARFYELIGSVGIMGSVYNLNPSFKDFGDVFNPVLKSGVLEEGRLLRKSLKGMVSF
ncbi:MAG: hypothetical protein FWH35_01695 [Treponema sp.]|nr:hypothetical protein [Treponema sp.]